MKSRILFLSLLLIGFQSLFAQQANIHPTPQVVSKVTDSIAKPQAVRLVGSNNADAMAVKLLQSLITEGADKKDFPIFIGERSDKDIKKYSKLIPNKTEGYYLSVEKDKIVVAGYDERGTYYGVQTLRQLLAQDKLPLITITDYPDITARGVVEGFYGTPWTFEDRVSQLKFYGENKLNTYIYGPKDDPYHSVPNWRIAYPAVEAKAIEQLVDVANENHVDFVWAIHPGLDIKWTTEDRDALVNKFESMYGLGVRAFAVFFDDISGEGVNADKQAELLNYVDNNFIKVKKDVLPLILCPTEYNKSWSNIEGGYLPTLGKKLNPSIHVMWTGDRVISDIDTQGLEWINKHIERKAYIWWNFPVSDYVRDHLLMGPAYGLDTKASNLMSGFMTNPMEFAEASKVAIYSVADYSWNIKSYDSMQSWENALHALMPNNYEAFRTFSIHNADLGPNGHGYRRDESWEFKDIANKYLQQVRSGNVDLMLALTVQEEFMDMMMSSRKLLQSKDNAPLIAEMTPWLMQFRLLGESGLATTQLQAALLKGDKLRFNQLYNHIKLLKEEMYNNSNTLNQNPYQPGVKTGSLVVEPLIDSVLTELGKQYTAKYDEQLPSLANYTPHLMYSNVSQAENLPIRYLRKLISVSPMLEVLKIPANGYVGLELVPAQPIASTKINIGLDEFPAWAAVQVSKDGDTWVPYEGKLNQNKDWVGGKLAEAYRYIRLVNTSGETQESYLKAFEVKTE
ncbi:MAG: beta-N-acetylglucosaminidase [Candidatus Saccharimonadaceae bacterium]